MKTETNNEPRMHNSLARIGNNGLRLEFEGEQYDKGQILDTKVTIKAGTICWITWDDRIKFSDEIQAVINKIFNMSKQSTYIRFSQHGEAFRWPIPEGMSLADGLTKVFQSSYPKIEVFLSDAERQIEEMNYAISMIPSSDPDKNSTEEEAKEIAKRMVDNCYPKIISIEVVKGSKTTYL